MMNNNSKAIIILCSFIGAKKQNVLPLQPREWSELALILKEKKLEPYQLLDFNQNIIDELNIDENMKLRIRNLISRSSAIVFELAKYEKLGIKCVTRADKNYPKILKDRLGNSCPPLIYYCGDLTLLSNNYVGFVGSRNISDNDIEITKKLVDICLKNNYGVISGGARGIDTESSNYCLKGNGKCIEILADSMMKKIKNKDYIEQIRNKNLLSLSLAAPEAGFDVGMAMMRNKYIYILSKGTIVITSSYNKGGTWNGAVECMKKGYSPICVVENNNLGNNELIKLGAKKIDESWDFKFDRPVHIIENKIVNHEKNKNIEQISLF